MADEQPVSKRGARRWVWGLIILVGLGASVVLNGSRRVVAPAMTGEGLSATPLAVDGESRVLRLATFNIASGRGKDGRVDLGRTMEQLKGFDLVGLNEVGAETLEVGVNQARQLGEMLHVPYLFAPTEYRFWRPHFGNGVLSVLPVGGWVVVPIVSTQAAGHRNVVLLRVMRAGVVVNVLITHVDRGPDRVAQLATVTRMFAALQPPAVLMGDLNTLPDDPLLAPLRAMAGVREPLAEVTEASGRRIDYIFTRGLVTRDAGVEDVGASDHPLVWADVEVPVGLLPTELVPAVPATQP